MYANLLQYIAQLLKTETSDKNVISLYEQLSTINEKCTRYKTAHDENKKKCNDYIVDVEITKQIRQLNISKQNINVDIFKKIMTSTKINNELLNYELLNYRAEEKQLFDIEKIKNDANRFNVLIDDIIEDKLWTEHLQDTQNFCVPPESIVLSNTLLSCDEDNKLLIEYMKNLTEYLKSCYHVRKLFYEIVEDNKYDISWIFIVIYQQ